MTVSFASPLFHGQGPNTARGLRVAIGVPCQQRPVNLKLMRDLQVSLKDALADNGITSWTNQWIHGIDSFKHKVEYISTSPTLHSFPAEPKSEQSSQSHVKHRLRLRHSLVVTPLGDRTPQREESLSVREIFHGLGAFFSPPQKSVGYFNPFSLPSGH